MERFDRCRVKRSISSSLLDDRSTPGVRRTYDARDPIDRTRSSSLPGLRLNYSVLNVLRIFEAIMAKRLIQSYCFHNGRRYIAAVINCFVVDRTTSGPMLADRSISLFNYLSNVETVRFPNHRLPKTRTRLRNYPLFTAFRARRKLRGEKFENAQQSCLSVSSSL